MRRVVRHGAVQATEVATGVFLGAGIRTINDKHLIWRDLDRQAELTLPTFREGCKVGPQSTILAGVAIGANSLVGVGVVVTCDIRPCAAAYGAPARIHAAGGRQRTHLSGSNRCARS